MKSSQSKSGFTIIEVLLVMSITALMLVGMLAGWNINIKRQQYNDSVESFKSDIQGIFDSVENMANDRKDKIRCYEKDGKMVAALDESNPNGGRGMTNCVLLGKFVQLGDNLVRVSNGGGVSERDVYVYNIIAKDINPQVDCPKKGLPAQCSNVMEALENSKPTILNPSAPERTINIEWNGTYKNVTPNNIQSDGFRRFGDAVGFVKDENGNKIYNYDITGLVIVRSPIDGTLVSFASNTSLDENTQSRDIKGYIKQKNIIGGDKTVDICIRPESNSVYKVSGRSIFGRNRVVRIGNGASSVQIAPLDGGSGSMSCGNGDGQGDVLFEGKKI